MEAETRQLEYAKQEAIVDTSTKQRHANRWKRRAKIGLASVLLSAGVLTNATFQAAAEKYFPVTRSFFDSIPVGWHASSRGALVGLKTERHSYSASVNLNGNWGLHLHVGKTWIPKPNEGYVDNYEILFDKIVGF